MKNAGMVAEQGIAAAGLYGGWEVGGGTGEFTITGVCSIISPASKLPEIRVGHWM